MTIRNFGLLLVAIMIFPTVATASDQATTQQSPDASNKDAAIAYLSEPEFLLQKEQMIKDTATKVEVLQAAHDCAKAAETAAAFAECNNKLRAAILGKAKTQ